jgi:hypothetical protein
LANTRYAYYISQTAKRKGNEMLLDTRTETVFATREIDGAKFIGGSKEQAEQVFTAWLNDNLDWITAGRESKAIEILDVTFDLVSFNGDVLVTWLCEECANDDCESNGEAHEETITNCRFEEVKFFSEYRF